MGAHVIRMPVIHCDAMPDGPDAPPCMATPGTPEDITTVRELRTHLRRLGWHAPTGNRDVCPDCWADGHR